MLVLTRKLGERIVVPDSQLTITVTAIEGKTVRLGISAPPEIGVYREELWQRGVQGAGALAGSAQAGCRLAPS
jgi:carbon storage regulator CsrA